MRTNNLRSGLKTVHTQKVVRKTTTISLGEKKESTHVKVRLERVACARHLTHSVKPITIRLEVTGVAYECGRQKCVCFPIVDAVDSHISPTHHRPMTCFFWSCDRSLGNPDSCEPNLRSQVWKREWVIRL